MRTHPPRPEGASAAASGQPEPSRRRFLAAAVGTLGVCPAIQNCVFIELEDTGDGSGGGGGNSITFSINDPTYAALAEVGKHVCAAFGPVQVILLRANEDEILAFERFCPHDNLAFAECGGGAQVQWDPENEIIVCPWHSSIFGRDGAVLSGPSPRALRFFPVTFDPATGVGTVSAGGPA